MSKSINNSKQLLPLSQVEIDELDDFLMSDDTSDETMALETLDGYLTAVVSGPVMLKLNEWLPGVWGPTEKDKPVFRTMAQARHIVDLILRHMNGIIGNLQDDPNTFEPVFGIRIYKKREYVDGEMWAHGYMCGIEICRKQWQSFFDDPNGWMALRPIHLLGSDDVTPEEESLTETPEQREELSKQIPASVAWIYSYWLPYRQAVFERTVASTVQRDQPKIGRNDPCPCGSGLKFKKCCGIAASLH